MTQSRAYQTRSVQRKAMQQQNAKDSCQQLEIPAQPPSALVDRSVCEMSSNTCPSTDLSGRVGSSDLSGNSYVDIPAYSSQSQGQAAQEVSTRRSSGQTRNPFAQQSDPFTEDDDIRCVDQSSAAIDLASHSLAHYGEQSMSDRFQFGAKRPTTAFYGGEMGGEPVVGGEVTWEGPPSEERVFPCTSHHSSEVIAQSEQDQAVLAALLQILAHYYIGDGTHQRLAEIVFKDIKDCKLHMQVVHYSQVILQQIPGEDCKFQCNPLILQQIATLHLKYYIANLQVQTGNVITQLTPEQTKEQQHSLNCFLTQIHHSVQERSKNCARQQAKQQQQQQQQQQQLQQQQQQSQHGRYTVAGYGTSAQRAGLLDHPLHDQVADCIQQDLVKLCQKLKVKNHQDVVGFAQHVWDMALQRAPQLFSMVEMTVAQSHVERVILLVCFWIAAKQFECRKNMPQGKTLAGMACVNPSLLVAVELHLLNMLDFDILSTYPFVSEHAAACY